ncbi:protoheme IX farnesyltransferase [Bacillus sp. PS06]|nr:protoheme IX farnesyltransferase [Bacillus sp. PS06]
MNSSINKTIVTSERISWAAFSKLIKTGIINSNVFMVFVGFYLALYVNKLMFLDHILTAIFTLIGAGLVIGGACAINNYYDRDIDSKMSRTLERPTVNGTVHPLHALWLGILFTTVGLIILFTVSTIAGVMGLLGFIFYVFAYTMLTKRRTVWNTEVGCLSGAVPPLIGWGAISGDLTHPIAIGLFLMMLFWQPPHFYALATRRVEEYRAAGVPMLPVVAGIRRTKIQSFLYLIPLLASSFFFLELGFFFITATIILTLVWMVIALKGFGKISDHKWATRMFVYSINYLMIVFSLMIIVTFFI